MRALELVPHPQAPLFDGSEGIATLTKLIQLLKKDPNAIENGSDQIRQIARQAGFVNLWFFLKYIAGYSGPYADLNEDLHVDMANWRQRALNPGARFAAFIPRGHCKSTILTHGADSWELLRNPDIRIGVFSCVYERALEFLHITQRTFDSNERVKLLYPEYVPETTHGARWNDKEAVLPNRTKALPEASIKAFTAGGSTAGIHVDLASFDDLVGDAQLNADRKAGAEMIRLGNWFMTNTNTLLISPAKSRITLAATRYAIDDPYEKVMMQAHVHSGFWGNLENVYKIDPKGDWDVYYRMGIEDGEVIYPENFTVGFYEKLAREDPWSYQTQYMNNPRLSSAFEFGSFDPPTCNVGQKGDDWVVEIWDEVLSAYETISLSACDLVIAADPAASDKMRSLKTSRSSIVVAALDWKGRYFIIEIRADFVPPSTFFEWLFTLRRKYASCVRQTIVETQGAFKILADVIRKEEVKRNEWLNLSTIPALGDKVITIRNIFEPILKANKLYVAELARDEFFKEFLSFPSARMDVLDAAKIALKSLIRPEDGGFLDDEEENSAYRSRLSRRSSITGY